MLRRRLVHADGWPSIAPPCQYVCEEIGYTPRQPLQVAGKRTADECGMSAFAGKIAMHARGNLVRSRQPRHRGKGIAAGASRHPRPGEAADQALRARTR